MTNFKKNFEVRWSDVDLNNHATHTTYAIFATHTRVEWLNFIGCSVTKLLQLGFGPVLLKEETEYYREINLSELITVELVLAGESPDHSRWKFIHYIYKENSKLAAKVVVYGAWLDSKLRKIAPPPPELLNLILKTDKTEEFEILQ